MCTCAHYSDIYLYGQRFHYQYDCGSKNKHSSVDTTSNNLISGERKTKLKMDKLTKTYAIFTKLIIRRYSGRVGIIGVPFGKGQVNTYVVIQSKRF